MDRHNKYIDAITDKAFSRLVVTSILGIFVCIVCLCSTTFAWFSDNAPSAGNHVTMAEECKLSVTVVRESDGSALENIESGVELVAGETYSVTLSLPAGSASGYCIIDANGNSYYTDYIARHSEVEDKVVTFDLTVEETQTVTFTTRWGIYSGECHVVDGALNIPQVGGASVDETDEVATDEVETDEVVTDETGETTEATEVDTSEE